MPAKCVYCGAELPEQEDVKVTCLVCDQEQPGQTVDTNQSGLSQPPEPESSSPEFSAPLETKPASDDSHSAPLPPPPPSPDAPAGPTEHTPAWELDGGFWLEKLWRTIWQVLFHPMYTFWAPGRMRQQYPLGFGLIVATVGSVVSVLWEALINTSETAFIAPIVVVFAAPIGILIGLYIGSGIMHLFLMIVGAAKGGFTATFRVTGYSYAGYIFMLIPLLGGIVAVVWMMVVQIAGLAATHGVTRWRVVSAILLFLAVLLAIIVTGAMMAGCGEFLTQLELEMDKYN